jgi:hypothetical protein
MTSSVLKRNLTDFHRPFLLLREGSARIWNKNNRLGMEGNLVSYLWLWISERLFKSVEHLNASIILILYRSILGNKSWFPLSKKIIG